MQSNLNFIFFRKNSLRLPLKCSTKLCICSVSRLLNIIIPHNRMSMLMVCVSIARKSGINLLHLRQMLFAYST